MILEDYKEKAKRHRDKGEFAEAVTIYRKIETLVPNNWENHIAIGDALIVLGGWEEAAVAYQKSLVLRENFDWAHYNLAVSLFRAEKYAKSDQSFRDLERINSNFRKSQENNFDVQQNLGNYYFRCEQWTKAAQAYQNAIRINANTYLEHLNLARALCYLGSIEKAVPIFSKAQNLKPESAWPTYYLSEFYFKAGKNQLAEQTCAKAISIDNSFPWAYHLKGQILRSAKKYQAALQAFQKAVFIQPDIIVARQAMGEIFIRLKQWQEAIHCFRQLINIEPNSYFSYCGLAEASSRLRQIDAAIASYQRAIDIRPDAADIIEKLALLQQSKADQPKITNQINHPPIVQAVNALSETRESNHKKGDRPITLSVHDRPYRISIKISAPNLRKGCQWGDYHYANSLKTAFEDQGHRVRIDCQDAWKTRLASQDDLVIVLRGRHFYQPQPHQTNFVWMISHPDRPTHKELNLYDHVFVASYEYALKLSQQITTEVSCMYQCTDPNVFYPPSQVEAPFSEVLFVGSSRNVFRPIVKDSLDSGIDISVYGPFWEQFIPTNVIKGTYIQNSQLNHYYNNCRILLNDHWETMRDEGFLSNRLFDASACETFVISDPVAGLERVFGDLIETYSHPSGLKEKVEYYTEHKAAGREKARKARDIVLSGHTFHHRAATFLEMAGKVGKTASTQPQIDPINYPAAQSKTLAQIQQQAQVAQMSWFHNNVASLSHGVRSVKAGASVTFYEWMWRIDWQNPNYGKFLKVFVDSEHELIRKLSNQAEFGQSTPLVSIVMPTFNRAYVIADGIQSILDQVYENWELLICDDGSTDNTEGVVRQFEDARIQYFQLPKGNGPTARNFGLQYASGKYIAYLDSDNIWHPQHLLLCVQTLLSNAYAMSCYTGYVDVELVKTEIDLVNISCEPFEYYKLLNRNFIDLNSLVHHRKLFEWFSGFDTSLPRLQDWDLALRYTYLFEPVVIDCYTVFYRRNKAWSQVTKLYSGLDIRNIVQKKALNVLRQGTISLQHDSPLPDRVSIVTSIEHWEDFSKSAAIAQSLASHIDTQLIIVGASAAEYAFEDLPAVKTVWIEPPALPQNAPHHEEVERNTTLEIEMLFSSEGWLSQLPVITDKQTVIVPSADRFLVAIALHLKDSYTNPVIVSNKGYQATSARDKGAMSRHSMFVSATTSAQKDFSENITTSMERQSPLFIEESSSSDGICKARVVGPSIIDKALLLSTAEDVSGKVDLGYSKKDFTIAFWDSNQAYAESTLANFRSKLGSERFQLIWVCSTPAISDEKTVNLTEVADGIKKVEVSNHLQASQVLRGADVAILWEATSASDPQNPDIPLAFVYSLISGCIPVLPDTPEAQEWHSYNYCRSVEKGGFQNLVGLCQELHNRPGKTAKLKKNGQKLYKIRFSQAVTAERIKSLLLYVEKSVHSDIKATSLEDIEANLASADQQLLDGNAKAALSSTASIG